MLYLFWREQAILESLVLCSAPTPGRGRPSIHPLHSTGAESRALALTTLGVSEAASTQLDIHLPEGTPGHAVSEGSGSVDLQSPSPCVCVTVISRAALNSGPKRAMSSENTTGKLQSFTSLVPHCYWTHHSLPENLQDGLSQAVFPVLVTVICQRGNGGSLTVGPGSSELPHTLPRLF